MKVYSDNKEKYAYYSYDDAGQRTYKMTFNAGYIANNHYGYPTLEVERMAFYPNGFMNINHYGEYTKHYYAENQRIASKLGTGSIIPANLCDMAYNYMSENELNNLRDRAEDKIQQDLTFVVIPETWVNMDYLGYNICNLQGDIYQNEDVLFFYHGNHLSSTQMITDMNGNVVQKVHYAPFGEIISEYNAYWHGNLTPNYTFNAKELDEETGMYYFEARYLKPPSFISRDPLFEKKPWLNPYHYCSNNPVNKIDPTGLFDTESEAKQYKKENHIRGKINFDGERWSIQNRKQGTSIFKDNTDVSMAGKDKNGIVTAFMCSSDRTNGSTSQNGKTNSILNDVKTGVTLETGMLTGAAKAAMTEVADNAKALKSLGNFAKWAGYVGAGLNASMSGYQAFTDPTMMGKVEHGADAIMSIVGATGLWGIGINAYYSGVIKNYPEIQKSVNNQCLDRSDMIQKGFVPIGYPGRSFK